MHRRSALPQLRPVALALVSFALIADVAAAPTAASATPLPGDPDTPAWGAAPATPSRSFLRRDLDRLASKESLRLLLAGGVLVGGTLALAAAGFAVGDANMKGAAGEMTRALVYTGITVTALKMGVQRTRPNGGAWSFPSGHTAAAFSVAPILAHHFGRLAAIPAHVFALGTGLGRMEDRKHYLSDVIAANANAAGPEFAIGPGGAQVTLHF